MQTTELKPLIGRDAQLDELLATMADGARVVTLRGPGGVGKTTLARRIAQMQSGIFVELEACTSVDDIVAAVGDSLGSGGMSPTVESVRKILGADEIGLLVLDNAEQVVEGVAEVVQEWLTGTETKFVVTSRVRLGIADETLCDVKPLAPEDAIELFTVRARAASPVFEVTEENRDSVESLVGLLDGLPLALELAAARVRVLAPRQIEERLLEKFELLKNRRADVERHETLDACIEWSWNLLQDDERDVLAQLGIFRGGFTMEDAEAIIETDEWVGDVLERLVEHSLLQVVHDARRTRFTMYDAVRRYVDRHAEQRSVVVVRFAELLLQKSEAAALEHYDLPNVTHVFELAVDIDPSLAVDLLVSARRRLLRGGFMNQLLELIKGALERDVSDVERARLLNAQATVHYARMEYASCDGLLGEAEAALEDVPEEQMIEPLAQILLLRAVRANERQEPESAVADLARARHYIDRLPDGLAAHTLAASGISAMKTREFERSAEFFDAAITRARRTPDVALHARTLSWSAFAPMAMGNLDRAIDRLEEALQLFAQTEDYISQTQAQYTLAQSLLKRSPKLAIENAREALRTARKSKLRILEAMTTIFVARVSDADDAPSTIRRALRVFGDEIANADRWSGWAALVAIYTRRSDLERAAHEAGLLRGAVERLGAEDDIRRARRYGAVVAAIRGEPEQVEALTENDEEFREAVLTAMKVGRVADEALERFDDYYDRVMLDFQALPLELMREVFAKRSDRRKMTLTDEGATVALPDGTEVDLESRYVLRRLLAALCRYHDRHPGQSMTLEELVDAGWPDETMTYESGIRRVYSAIRNIRKLGFEEVVLTGENGYLIDPDIDIVWD